MKYVLPLILLSFFGSAYVRAEDDHAKSDGKDIVMQQSDLSSLSFAPRPIVEYYPVYRKVPIKVPYVVRVPEVVEVPIIRKPRFIDVPVKVPVPIYKRIKVYRPVHLSGELPLNPTPMGEGAEGQPAPEAMPQGGTDDQQQPQADMQGQPDTQGQPNAQPPQGDEKDQPADPADQTEAASPPAPMKK